MYAIQSNVQVVNGCKIDRYKDREEAVNAFLEKYKELSGKFEVEMHLRNDKFSDARGSIQVLVDGFFHYVELYKEK